MCFGSGDEEKKGAQADVGGCKANAKGAAGFMTLLVGMGSSCQVRLLRRPTSVCLQ